jgi:hypothetical protein
MKVVSRGHSLFRNRWILLMKSGDVKTKKQNYLVFSPTPSIIRLNLPRASFQALSFSYLPFSITQY